MKSVIFGFRFFKSIFELNKVLFSSLKDIILTVEQLLFQVASDLDIVREIADYSWNESQEKQAKYDKWK